MASTDPHIDRLTERIIGCGIEVHKELGPGLLESVYRECMCIELKSAQLDFEAEQRIPLKYKGTQIHGRLQIDLLVEGLVIVELKSVDRIHPDNLSQGVT
jgi:GxxExxY protein